MKQRPPLDVQGWREPASGHVENCPDPCSGGSNFDRLRLWGRWEKEPTSVADRQGHADGPLGLASRSGLACPYVA